MRRFGYLGLCLVAAVCAAKGERYTATWDSLVNYEAPEWYEDAKLGFWPIWGVFSVPAFKGDHAAEWYGRWMYCKEGQSSRNNQGLATHFYHKQTYGDPGTFGYKDLIPKWKAERFDPDSWADLCVEGGAKFFCTLAVFHDSFCLWDSDLTEWNSVDMGPQRDIVKELGDAMRKRGLKYGVSNHSAWNYGFFQWNHINGYDARDPANQDLYGNPIIPEEARTAIIKEGEDRVEWLKRSRWNLKPSERDLDRWLERTKEVTDKYHPDLHYFDWGMNPDTFTSRRMEFAAHYYNKAMEWGGSFEDPGVVLNYKNWKTFKPGTGVRDFERGGMRELADMVWQTDDSIYDGNNWGYAEGVPIKPTDMIVDQLMDVISKRGVLMLAIAPKADGTFPEDQKQFIRELGAWLKVCGEAVYCTRPYEIYGEVSDTWYDKDDHGHLKFEGQPDDIRFTRSKDNTVLYATFLAWPGEQAVIKTFAGADLKGVKSISLLGRKGKLDWDITEQGLHIMLPEKAPEYGMAYPVRIEFEDQIISSIKK
ncbi:alpha-L-fucosidase [Pontiella agarivorans]|uniref:alpha-L-fucosidase n=1 Tax=Pontiella agarivorans TaxID=3038953 RepID=A0ABU5MSZ7_9BACT|nr:alpha-L-fucosidase [Pontiella agarivorans]MDZ8117238.1 alpha-L-fucosidase [Pontiella agarivorans]